MTESVTVLMPVGPNYNPEWLQEAIASVLQQEGDVHQLLIIGDGVDLGWDMWNNLPNFISLSGEESKRWGDYGGYDFFPSYGNPEILSYCKLPAHVGFSSTFNLGVGMSKNELVMFLAADDKLMPTAVEEAVATWEKHDRKDAWYHLKYIDSNGHVSQIHNNIALTTKHFFLDMCGGYPPAAFVGPDAALMSCLMVHAPDRIIPVISDKPLYWIRDHDQQETKIHTWKYVPEMNSIRGKLTAEFKLNE